MKALSDDRLRYQNLCFPSGLRLREEKNLSLLHIYLTLIAKHRNLNSDKESEQFLKKPEWKSEMLCVAKQSLAEKIAQLFELLSMKFDLFLVQKSFSLFFFSHAGAL